MNERLGRDQREEPESAPSVPIEAVSRAIESKLDIHVKGIRLELSGIKHQLQEVRGSLVEIGDRVAAVTIVVGRVDTEFEHARDEIRENSAKLERVRVRLGRRVDSITSEVERVSESGQHPAIDASVAARLGALEAERDRERARAERAESVILGREDKASERKWEAWKIVLGIVAVVVPIVATALIAGSAGEERGRKHERRDRTEEKAK